MMHRALMRRALSAPPLVRRRALATAIHPIHNTIHRFFHILDGLEPEAAMSELFTADGTLHVHKADLKLGASEIDGWVARMRGMWDDQTTLHTEGNIVIQEPEAGLIVSHSTWSAFVGGSLASYGTHADILKHVEGSGGEAQWKFQKRVVRHLYSAP